MPLTAWTSRPSRSRRVARRCAWPRALSSGGSTQTLPTTQARPCRARADNQRATPAGVDVSTKHVERAAEALGREIAEDERRSSAPPEADEPLAPTLYLGMDGTGVPMRASELEGCKGKQLDGTSKTREVKLCVVRQFTMSPRVIARTRNTKRTAQCAGGIVNTFTYFRNNVGVYETGSTPVSDLSLPRTRRQPWLDH